MPFVSVIVPIYKVEKFLRRCIDSILGQTFEDFELILIDDGSPDQCPQICNEYKSHDQRIKVIHKENGGLSSARNAGLDIAQGKYILFVDSDDYIKSDLLEICVSTLESGNYDAIRFGYEKIDSDCKKTHERLPKKHSYSFNNDSERLNYLTDFLLPYKIPFTAWSCLFKNEIIKKNNLRFYSERIIYSEDTFFSVLYTLYSNNCYALDKALYVYQDNENSLRGTYKSKHELLLNKCVRWSKELYSQCTNQYFKDHFYQIATAFYKNELPFSYEKHNIKYIIESIDSLEDKKYFSDQHQKLFLDLKQTYRKKVGRKQTFKDFTFIKYFISFNKFVFRIRVAVSRLFKF